MSALSWPAAGAGAAAAAAGVIAAWAVVELGRAQRAAPAADADRQRAPTWLASLSARLLAPGRSVHLAAAAAAFAAALVVAGPFAALVIGACGGGASVIRTRRAAGRRRDRCERGTPGLARSLADALRGGASIRHALEGAAEDRSVPAAMREAVGGAARGVRLGASLEGALAGLSERGGPGLRLLCGTVAMYREAGGALAAALERLAVDGEAALRIDDDRVAATAQARATVRVVAALPLLALVGAELASRDFILTIARSPLATALMLLGFTLEAVAILAARVIVGSGR